VATFPQLFHITDGKTHEVTVLDELLIEPGAFYLLDRGYLDFGRLYALHQSHAFFVTRAKSNTQCKRRYSHAMNRATTNVFCDQTGMLTVYTSRKEYPAPLRRVVITDVDGKRLTFLTNHFVLTPELIAALYRQRWQVELFFKWIKQHLRISTSHKHTSSNLEFMLSAEDPDIFMRARSTSEVAVLTKDSRISPCQLQVNLLWRSAPIAPAARSVAEPTMDATSTPSYGVRLQGRLTPPKIGP